MFTRPCAAAIAAALLCAAPAASQSLGPADYYEMRQQARGTLEAGRFEEAFQLYERLTRSNPWAGALWLEYARAAEGLNRREAAVAGLQKAFELGVGWSRPYLARQIAAEYVRLGDRAAALDWLEKALEARWRDRTEFEDDTAFVALRGDPRFAELAGVLPDREFTRIEGWRYDLAYLIQEARRLHKDVERPAFSREFEETADRLNERIPELTDAEIVIEMRRLLTLLNDGHTGIERREGATRLPIELYVFSDGLFVIDTGENAVELRGAQVLAFGPVSTEQVFEALEELVPRDNPMGIPWVGPRVLADPVLLQVIGATDDSTRVTLTIRDRSGREREVSVAAISERPASRSRWKLPPPRTTPDTTPLFLQRVTDSFWFTPLPDTDAVYFQYNQVRPRHRDESVAGFASRLQRALEETGARNLIVDVRHNSGGNSYTFPPLIRIMAWFRQASPENEIYMLIGRNTFSAAQNFTNIATTLVAPVLVGEPTGSKPSFVGESGGFRLPYSGARANVSFRTHQGTIWDEDPIWIAPDVPVELSSEDYFADRDPVMEAVRALIRARRSSM